MGTPNPAFVFPPPPPPPPRAAASSPGYPPYTQSAYPQDNGYVSRGNHGSGGYRGRGRGDGHRGRGNQHRGGRGGSPNQSGYYAPVGYQAQGPYPPAASTGYGQSGYSQPGPVTGSSSYPQQWPQRAEPSQTQMGPQFYPPPTPQNQPPQYQQPAPQQYYPQPHPASLHPPFTHQPPYIPASHQPPYNTNPQAPFPSPYPQPWQPPTPQQSWQPPVQHFHHPQLPFGNPNHQSAVVPNSIIHGNPNYIDYTQSTRKRGGSFSRPHNSAPRLKASPVVPSFLALPPKPPPQVSLDGRGSLKGQRPKKKRKFNALGLTPKKEEHEDTEEEDVDEEAAVGQTLGQQKELSIAYGDQQVVLKSNEDVEKWIEERKRRYPTKARVEEKKAESKRTVEEAAATRKRASRKAKEKRRKEREKQQAREDLERRRKEKKEKAAKNLAIFLEKKARQAGEAQQGTVSDTNGAQDVSENPMTPAKELPDTSKKRKLEDGQDEIDTTVDDNAVEASTTTLSGHSSGADLEISDGDTGESMSISSGASSDTSSDSESDSDRPEESSFRHKDPVRVPAPKRERRSKQICRQFRQSGNCFRGNQCRFIHDIPGPNEGGYKTRNVAIRERRKEIKKRKGIYQAVGVPTLTLQLSADVACCLYEGILSFLANLAIAQLVESEKEKDNLLVLEAIRFLGDRGVLNMDEGSGDRSDAGGHERCLPDVKQENLDDGNVPENRGGEGLPRRLDKEDGQEENHVKIEEDGHPMRGGGGEGGQEGDPVKEEEGEVDRPLVDDGKENSGTTMPIKQEKGKFGIKDEYPDEGKKDNTAPEENSKEHIGEIPTNDTEAS
ncbi:MAG: hypothetical protein M1839_005471 [Geoglossum umbratile]|nr:MAG: hypothetical protein M1839_005471 [Geoglossum umbratile]